MNQQLPAEPDPRPDRRLEGHDVMGRKIAGCSLWWSEPLMVNGHPAGLIGHYAAETPEAGCALLQQALEELRDHGCALAVGPMDGNTWGNYRFVTGGSGEPPFFLEPDHPPEWPAHFRAAGFTPLARYHSSVTSELALPDAKADRAEKRLRESGCRIRSLVVERLEQELQAIHRISLAAFHSAFLYQPISFEAFAAAQEKLVPLIRPELVLIAERRGEAVGFVFALPDLRQAQRGRPVDTAIIKTLAVLPGRDQAGLGVCLVRRIHQTAHELGYSRVIHALMHEANTSLNIHRSASHPLREYTLFCQTL